MSGFPDPSQAIRYAEEDRPGLTRHRVGDGWVYYSPDGSPIDDEAQIRRLNAIALPPAYTDAWYAPEPDAHIQAFGYDARGRRQYRYHPDYRRDREARKFELCAAFGHALPLLRQQVEKDVAVRHLTRERAVASVIRLLDTGCIRVGNECYARSNKTFGATTLRMRHLRQLGRKEMVLRFRGKGGLMREVRCNDAHLLRFARKMQDLPGQNLFQYLSEDGSPIPVGSAEVNAYLRQIMGDDFTARNFRTWTASTLAFEYIWNEPEPMLKPMLALVSDRLGNTPAVARKSYVHPAVVALAAGKGEELGLHLPQRLPRQTRWLTRMERGLLDLLDTQPARDLAQAGS